MGGTRSEDERVLCPPPRVVATQDEETPPSVIGVAETIANMQIATLPLRRTTGDFTVDDSVVVGVQDQTNSQGQTSALDPVLALPEMLLQHVFSYLNLAGEMALSTCSYSMNDCKYHQTVAGAGVVAMRNAAKCMFTVVPILATVAWHP